MNPCRSAAVRGLMLSLCAGCALQAPTPSAPPPPGSFDHAERGAAVNWPAREWYRGFASPELDNLIAAATRDNVDLTAARWRVAQADARARQAHSGILPSVDAGGNVNYLAGHSADGSAHETDWSALLSTSYEVDFWGRNRAALGAARHLAIAARADRDTVTLTTLAGVANGYFEVLSLRERLAIARADVAAARSLSAIVEARFQAGLANPVEVAAERSTLATAELAIPELERQEAAATASLALLTGRPPEGFRVAGQPFASLREPSVSPGLPSELLRRRPDVFTAEAKLESANADLVAARAAMFPSLSLTAAGGLQNPALNAAVISLSGVGPTLNLGASLTQPLFDAGRLRAVHEEVRAQQEELAATYRASILAALVDVENALSALQHLDAARRFQDENVQQSERAFEGAQLRLEAGSGDFLTALEAQRTVFTVRDQYSQYRLARLEALVSLCKALGGGWEAPDVRLSPAAASTSTAAGAPPASGRP